MSRLTKFLIACNTIALSLVLLMTWLHLQAHTSESKMILDLAGIQDIAELPGSRPVSPLTDHPTRADRETEREPIPASPSVEPELVSVHSSDGATKDKLDGQPPTADVRALLQRSDILAEKMVPIGADVSVSNEQVTHAGDLLVAEVQTALILEGLDPGPVDGAIGPKTRAAIRKYQLKQGWHPDGRIDFDLVRSLKIELEPQDTFARDWFFAPFDDDTKPEPEISSETGRNSTPTKLSL